MKTAHIFSALFISTALMATACTPRDVKVGTDEQRAKIRSLAKNKSNNKSSSSSVLGDNALVAFLMEKQIEAVELVKIATASLDEKKTLYVLKNQAENEDGSKAVSISAVPGTFEYVSNGATWAAKSNKTLTVTYTEQDGIVNELKATGKMSTTVDSVPKGSFINLFEDSYTLDAKTDAQNTDVLKIKVSINGKIKRSKTADEKITVNVEVNVNKKTLDTSDVEVVSYNTKMTYPGPAGKTYNMAIQGQSLSFNAEGLCNSADGTVTAAAGPRKFSAVFQGEELTIGKWTRSLATCGKRPTVEVSRLLDSGK